jgi:hypothetical protein
MERMPSPATAERNQHRKLAFIPVWPIVASVIVVVLLFVFFA